ncbi:Suppressor of SWI4 1-like [Hondaea fermentalgiana]|uniref:Suppressor of SWI4 1-like n=1 Tax=Hondaea fermentalgiana TaxID=2315210 RepID=A0A2R5GFN7_9STRA|nr:Suppressor of SWI4 1-like [Hondaea fermentalgiana]|eukprot:GBG29129.1 Suppressor of SWI4 1-like [Hondaea fermentalgiana]
MPRRGKRRVKTRTHVPVASAGKKLSAGAAAKALLAPVDAKKLKEQEEARERPHTTNFSKDAEGKDVPRSIVVRHGRAGGHLTDLVEDLRKVMGPYTATKLRERRNAVLKDYVMAAGPLGVSHLLVVSQATSSPTLRVTRLPHGPTLAFRIARYTLSNPLRKAQRRVYDPDLALQHPPLVVLNNFEESILAEKRHLKVVSLAFQSMFPAINVKTVRLADCKRVLLLHLNEEDESIEVRHFMVRTKPRGVTRQVKAVLRAKLPNMSTAKDIGDMLEMQTGYPTSESEFEDDEACVNLDPRKQLGQVHQNTRLIQKHKMRKIRDKFEKSSGTAGRAAASEQNQSVVRLSEIGPRMTLELVKVEDGVFGGEVQYHRYNERTKDEIVELRQMHEERKRVKEERKAIQEANVERKRKEKEDKLARRAEKRKRAEEAQEASAAGGGQTADKKLSGKEQAKRSKK